MRNKALDNSSHLLEFAPKCFMIQKVCGKAVNTYSSTIKCLPECFMNQEKCDKTANRCFLYLFLSQIYIKLKKCVTELFFKIFFLIVSCPEN